MGARHVQQAPSLSVPSTHVTWPQLATPGFSKILRPLTVAFVCYNAVKIIRGSITKTLLEHRDISHPKYSGDNVFLGLGLSVRTSKKAQKGFKNLSLSRSFYHFASKKLNNSLFCIEYSWETVVDEFLLTFKVWPKFVRHPQGVKVRKILTQTTCLPRAGVLTSLHLEVMSPQQFQVYNRRKHVLIDHWCITHEISIVSPIFNLNLRLAFRMNGEVENWIVRNWIHWTSTNGLTFHGFFLHSSEDYLSPKLATAIYPWIEMFFFV